MSNTPETKPPFAPPNPAERKDELPYGFELPVLALAGMEAPNPAEVIYGPPIPEQLLGPIEELDMTEFVDMFRGVVELEEDEFDPEYFHGLLRAAIVESEDPGTAYAQLQAMKQLIDTRNNPNINIEFNYPHRHENRTIGVEFTDVDKTIEQFKTAIEGLDPEVHVNMFVTDLEIPEERHTTISDLEISLRTGPYEGYMHANARMKLSVRDDIPSAFSSIEGLIAMVQLNDYFKHIPELAETERKQFRIDSILGTLYKYSDEVELYFGYDFEEDEVVFYAVNKHASTKKELDKALNEITDILTTTFSVVASNTLAIFDSNHTVRVGFYVPEKLEHEVSVADDEDEQQQMTANKYSPQAIEKRLMEECEVTPDAVTFDDIYGIDDIKQDIIDIIDDDEFKEEYDRLGYKYRKVLTFVGEKGSGKTMTANAIAWHVNADHYFEFSEDKIIGTVIGQDALNIAAMFRLLNNLAKEGKKVVAVIEEADSIISPRSNEGHVLADMKRSAVNAFLRGLNGLHSDVILIITANDKTQLDSTAMRSGRVRKEFEFVKPTSQGLAEVVEGKMTMYTKRNDGTHVYEPLPEAVAEYAYKYSLSPADVDHALQESGMREVRRAGREGRAMEPVPVDEVLLELKQIAQKNGALKPTKGFASVLDEK